jgi:hypothetical protein
LDEEATHGLRGAAFRYVGEHQMEVFQLLSSGRIRSDTSVLPKNAKFKAFMD